jgi:hypothetical protein
MSAFEKISGRFSPKESPLPKNNIRIEQHFLPEVVTAEAPYAQLKDLYTIPEAASIKKAGTRIGDPDEYRTGLVYSLADSSDKYTEQADMCSLVIVTGDLVEEPAEKISQLFHITPQGSTEKAFQRELHDVTSRFSAQTQEDSREIIIAGGLYVPKDNCRNYRKRYKNMITIIDKIVKEELGKPPLVFPPKRRFNLTHAYYATQEKKLTIVESGEIQEPTGELFTGSQLKKAAKRWD